MAGNSTENDEQNVDSNAERKVYGDRPGDIPTPFRIHLNTHLLSGLQADGSFDYIKVDKELFSALGRYEMNRNDIQGWAQAANEAQEAIRERQLYNELESSVDETIYTLLDIDHRVRYVREDGNGEEQLNYTNNEMIKKAIPSRDLSDVEQKQLYNMKYYIYSNLLGEDNRLNPEKCGKFASKLNKNLVKLNELNEEADSNALNYLKSTSDVTKLTYILGAATDGEQAIINTDYIKDLNAEKKLREESGIFFTNSVDDYVRYWDKLGSRDGKSLDGSETRELYTNAFTVSMAILLVTNMILIAGTMPYLTLLVGTCAAVGAYAAVVTWGHKLFTKDNHNFVFDDVEKRMSNKDIKGDEAVKLLGTVNALLADPNSEKLLSSDKITKLESYKIELEGDEYVEKLQRNNVGLKNIFSSQVEKINEAYNNRPQRHIGLGRERITKTDLDEFKNNLTNENIIKSVSTDNFSDNLNYEKYHMKSDTNNLSEMANLRLLVKSQDDHINRLKNEIQTYQEDNIKKKHENMNYAHESIKRSKVDSNNNIVVMNEINNNHNEKIKTGEGAQKHQKMLSKETKIPAVQSIASKVKKHKRSTDEDAAIRII